MTSTKRATSSTWLETDTYRLARSAPPAASRAQFCKRVRGSSADKKYLFIKYLKNGNLLVHESKSYDLVEYSAANFKEIKRIKGIPGVGLDQEAMRTSRHSHDEGTLPWMKGNGDISLINMKDFSMREVLGFFGSNKDTDLLPMFSVASRAADKVFGVSFIKEEVKLCFYERSGSNRYFGMKEVFTRCKTAITSRNRYVRRSQPR